MWIYRDDNYIRTRVMFITFICAAYLVLVRNDMILQRKGNNTGSLIIVTDDFPDIYSLCN